MAANRLTWLASATLLFAASSSASAQPMPLNLRTGGLLVSDTAIAKVYLLRDLDNDDDALDPGEISVFFDGANDSGLPAPTGNVFVIFQSVTGHVFLGDGDTDTVYRLLDLNGDGDAQDAGEAHVWFSAAGNAGGFSLPTPNGISQDAAGATYIVNAGTGAFPADVVYRTVDLNADGDAQDPGEAAVWFNTQSADPASTPFEIVFIGDTAFITDLAGGNPDVVWRARDADSSGAIGPGEFNVFIADGNAFGAPVALGLATDGAGLYVLESSATATQTIYRLTDLDASGAIDHPSEAVLVWTEGGIPPPAVAGGTNGLAVGPGGELAVASSATADAGDNVFRLLDLTADGDFLDADETIVFKDSGGGAGAPLDTARAVQYIRTPPVTVFEEDFDNACNTGRWSYFGDPDNPVEVIEAAGGNPGAYLHSTCSGLNCLDTFAPMPRTQLGVSSLFTGDYRARRVAAVGIDLILHDVDFSAGGRPLALILVNARGTPKDPGDDLAVYFLGSENVPLVGEGWKSYDFAIPSQDATMPAGWANLSPSGAGDDADWNTVISGVDQVRFFYGDPTFFYIFQQWEPGMDNPRITFAGDPLGDMNCDGAVTYADVAPFVAALIDPAAYVAAFPCCDINRADVNADGDRNGKDIAPFTARVLGEAP